MASTIKVNNIQNQCGANIANKCGSTVTLGASGDTITLACGASQTGFGRTGTVDWDTTAKTASFTAVSGNGYFVNTTSGAVTVTLPASPSAGDIVAVSDYANTSVTNTITVARNGSNIEGAASDLNIENNGIALTFVYVDGTRGWKVVNAGKEGNKSGVSYMIATGGTETTCGDYKIHTFTGPGTFCVSSVGDTGTVDYLVVAGGGGAGGGDGSGGGGAGGYRESSGTASGCYTASPLGSGVSALPVSATGYPITVGGGGNGQSSPPNGGGDNGSNSVFSTITSTGGGGGGGGGGQPVPVGNGNPGGSGGGGGGRGNCGPKTGGSGNTPPVSPPQGNNGGNATPSNESSTVDSAGGGGGATAAGTNGTASSTGGNGGNGATTSISASPTAYAGGGAGGSELAPTGTGGTGGGGESGNAGTVNTGGGGSGTCGPSCNLTGGNGGSGIVIIRYKYQ
jgi:hypothetical protein